MKNIIKKNLNIGNNLNVLNDINIEKNLNVKKNIHNYGNTLIDNKLETNTLLVKSDSNFEGLINIENSILSKSV